MQSILTLLLGTSLFLSLILANPITTSTSPTTLSSPTSSNHHTTSTTTTLPTATVTVSGTSSPPPKAGVTPAPDPLLSGADLDNEAAARFRQTTYWSCVQQPGVATAHCGWHVPIVDASMPNAAGRRLAGGGGAGRVGTVLAVVIVVVGLVVGL